MRNLFGLLLGGLLVTLSFAVAGCDRSASEEHAGQTVPIDQVPAVVKATIDQQAHGGNVSAIEKTTWKGTTIYSVPVLLNGKERRLIVAEDGRLVADHLDDDDEDDD